jgi:dipeptidyl aminopeptidase/acylaminoacyl peptidase
VRLPDKEGCLRTEYLLPHPLPDGRLGLARDCEMEDPEQSHIDLIAYDSANRRLEVLAPLGKDNPNAVSWRKDLQTGYVSHGSGICDGVAPLSRQGAQRFPEPITLEGHTWRLEEVFFQAGNEDCKDQGRADIALLTPDERHLVFLASPKSQGQSGQARLDHPWHLYIQDLPSGTPRTLVRGFSDTRGIAVSPDGKHVAIAERRGDEQGLWLVNIRTGDMRKLAGVRFSWPAFSPDGSQLAVILSEDIEHAELYVLNLSAP